MNWLHSKRRKNKMQTPLNIWHSILSSKSDSSVDFHNVEYWSNREPFNSSLNTIGAIDFATVADNSIFIRGWIICLDKQISLLEINLSQTDIFIPVLTHCLSRLDVVSVLSFIPCAKECGFVCETKITETLLPSPLLIKFKATMVDGEVREGLFESVDVDSDTTGDIFHKIKEIGVL